MNSPPRMRNCLRKTGWMFQVESGRAPWTCWAVCLLWLGFVFFFLNSPSDCGWEHQLFIFGDSGSCGLNKIKLLPQRHWQEGLEMGGKGVSQRWALQAEASMP